MEWSWAAAKRCIDFFAEVLRLNAGEHEGQPFVLSPFQVFKTGCLFGWLRANGARRFRVAYIEEGKGSGKSPWAAGVGLFMMMADGEARAEVYSAAVDRDQASIVFRHGVAMVDKSPMLDERIDRSGGPGREFNLAYLATGSFFRPIASENQGRGKSGLLPHCTLLDEVHEHKTSAMVEFMRAGVKSRRQPLTIMITNSGHDRLSVCWDQHEYGRKVVERLIEDDEYFACICGLDEEDDPFEDESCWIKANPNLGVSLTYEYLRGQVREAKNMPAKKNLVRRLNFCQWTESSSRWIDHAAWAACDGAVDLDELKGRACVAALDLSGRRDLTSLTLLFDGIDGLVHAAQWHWLPADGLMDREQQQGIPWTAWRDAGHLRVTPGGAIDRSQVGREIVELFNQYRPWGLAYDRAKFEEVQAALSAAGWTGERFTTKTRGDLAKYRQQHPDEFVFIDWGQGSIDMEPAVDALDALIADATLRHGGNPIMTMCAANAMIKFDDADNRKLVKERAALVIDSIVSLAMAAAAREVGGRFGGDGIVSYLAAEGASLALLD